MAVLQLFQWVGNNFELCVLLHELNGQSNFKQCSERLRTSSSKELKGVVNHSELLTKISDPTSFDNVHWPAQTRRPVPSNSTLPPRDFVLMHDVTQIRPSSSPRNPRKHDQTTAKPMQSEVHLTEQPDRKLQVLCPAETCV